MSACRRRLRWTSLLAALACAAPAGATEVRLVFSGTTGAGQTGSNTILVSNTAAETLTLDAVLDIDAEGVRVYGASFEFDREGADELDLLEPGELHPEGFDGSTGIRSSQESGPGSLGFAYGYFGTESSEPVANQAVVFARMVFVTRPGNVSLATDDVVSGVFSMDGGGGDDGIFDATLSDITSAVSFGRAHVGPAGDADGDGVQDQLDVCLEMPDAAQTDADGDGCGNACDADFNQDGGVGIVDFAIYRSCFGRVAGVPGGPPDDPDCAESDLNGDGAVGIPDFAAFRFLFGAPPGPSFHPERDRAVCP